MTHRAEVMAVTERWYGVFVALVTDLRDPDGLGRVKITLPWAPDSDGSRYEAWARIATLMAGGKRGSWFVPDVDDEVLVAFDAGDSRTPYVIGGLWNGTDAPPFSMDSAGRNNTKMIRSRNGVTITLDDTQGSERCVIETPGGQKVTLSDGPGVVEIADANGNTVKLESAGVTVTSSATVTVQASQVKVSAASVSVNAGMSTFSGVVKADTVIANAVISASYTPGAGNIW
ncbi:MAG: hypothetical protein QOE53_2287 [Pseudonocardiales bacterium]|nr:hypothetical protein [Pseudonocardiales bacterium]